MEREEHDFFAAIPAVLPIYERLKDRISAVVPQVQIEVRKSQISFRDMRVFAAVWLPLKKIKGRPIHYLIVTLWLDCPLRDARIAEAAQIHPGRWANHIIVADASEVDDELLGWVAEAVKFSRH